MAPSRTTRCQTKFEACPILDLPPELRIMVHKFVLADYQKDMTSIKGALLSCKQMKAELEDKITKNLIREITPVLEDVTKVWNKKHLPFRASMPVHTEGVKRPQVQIDLVLPASSFGSRPYSTHLVGMKILHPLMMLNIARLKISRFDDSQFRSPGPQLYPQSQEHYDLHLLFEESHYYSKTGERIVMQKTQVRQICFDFGTASTKEGRRLAYIAALQLGGVERLVPCTLDFENYYGSRVRLPYPPMKLSRRNVPVRAIWSRCSLGEMVRHRNQELLRR